MPCRDWQAEDEAEVRERLDKVTRMLCWLCHMNPNPYLLQTHRSPEAIELREWFEAHQKLDAENRGK